MPSSSVRFKDPPFLRITSLLLLNVRFPPATALAEIHPQLPSIDNLLLQMLLGAHRGRDIDEVGVSEASRLAGAAIDGYADVEDVSDFAEKVLSLR